MPTAEQRAFWSAIRANPLDDTPRLVYADWLQEHSDETRAEFIRVQCALALLGPDRRRGRKQRLPLESQEALLLTKYREAWFSQFRARLKGSNRWDPGDEWLDRLPFRRGFVDAMHLGLASAGALALAGDELEPVDRIGVMECAANYESKSVAAITQWSGAGCVVWFSIANANDKDVISVIHPGYLRNLSHLGLWYGTVSDKGVVQLAESPLVASLRSMDLQDNPITDAGAFALAESPHLSKLTRLALHRTRIGSKGRIRLRDRFSDALQIEAEP
jgi:uncharacterized protein (TIGR02996 family)